MDAIETTINNNPLICVILLLIGGFYNIIIGIKSVVQSKALLYWKRYITGPKAKIYGVMCIIFGVIFLCYAVVIFIDKWDLINSSLQHITINN